MALGDIHITLTIPVAASGVIVVTPATIGSAATGATIGGASTA